MKNPNAINGPSIPSTALPLPRWAINVLPVPVRNILRPAYHFTFNAGKYLLRMFFKALRAVLGTKFFLKFFHYVDEEIDTTIVVDGYKFEARHFIPYRRAVSMFTKEPETIAWIDEYVKEGDVFYDVGANIGNYSLYAAK
jgi:hypothetical protein